MFKQTFDQLPETIWVATVQAATVWTNPDSPREIDKPALGNPADVEKWVSSLTQAEKLALSDDNLIQTQLLLGGIALVIETDGVWAKVVIPDQPSKKDKRGYPGWIPLVQLQQTTKTAWLKERAVTVTANQAWLTDEDSRQQSKISFMTTLPLLELHGEKVVVSTPQGKGTIPKADIFIHESMDGMPRGNGQDIFETGKVFLGLAYFWGGMSAIGYDCSGFAHMMHKANGYLIGRDATDQANAGKKIEHEAALPGDLLFFAYDAGNGRIHHVGIYAGNGNMLHAPQTGKGIEMIPLAGSKYEPELCSIRRYWQKGT